MLLLAAVASTSCVSPGPIVDTRPLPKGEREFGAGFGLVAKPEYAGSGPVVGIWGRLGLTEFADVGFGIWNLRFDLDSRMRVVRWRRLELVAIPRVTPYLSVFEGAFLGGDGRASLGVTYVANEWLHFGLVAGVFGSITHTLDPATERPEWVSAWGPALTAVVSASVWRLRLFADGGILVPIDGEIRSWGDYSFAMDDRHHVAFTVGVAWTFGP